LPGVLPALSVSRWHYRNRKCSELPKRSPNIRNLLACPPFSQIHGFYASERGVRFQAWRRDTAESHIFSRQSRDACSLGKWSKAPHPPSLLVSGSVGKRDAVADFPVDLWWFIRLLPQHD